jgi:hypothetical protein
MPGLHLSWEKLLLEAATFSPNDECRNPNAETITNVE